MKNKLRVLLSIAVLSSFLAACTGDTNSSSEASSNGDPSSIDASSASSLDSGASSAQGATSQGEVATFEYDSTYYPSVNPNLYGESFLTALRNDVLALQSRTSSYDHLKEVLTESDANPDTDYKTMVPFYHDAGDDDLATSWNGTWNREHVWPDSRGAEKTGTGSDPHVIRPTITNDNSSRGNNFYGTTGGNTFDPGSLGYEAARGQASRIIMYCVVRWGDKQGLSLSNNPGDAASKKTMGVLSELLEWNANYEVTKMELSRQAYLDVGDGDDSRNSSEDYGRNPFIDHPSYANYIWDENGLRTTPYGGGSGGGDTPTTSVEPTWTHKQVTSLDAVDGKKLAIVWSSDSVSMCDYPANETREWYLASSSVTVSGENMRGNPDLFTFSKQSDGTYTITAENGDLLNSYISSTHYSICVGTPAEYDNTSTSWTISDNGSGEFTFKGGYSYLNYTSSYGTWSGAKSAPSGTITLFEAI